MNKIFILFAAILIATNSIYTSKYWAKKGFDVKDGKISHENISSVQVDTTCNQIDLTNTPPYDYNGTVMTGYMKVGKGNSALGFIFYGK